MATINLDNNDNVYVDTDDGNTINGLGGNDNINGAGGNDILTGGVGNDVLTGGTGVDTFLDSASGLNGDRITDFLPGDRIFITDLNYSQLTIGTSGHFLIFHDPTHDGAVQIDNLGIGRLVIRNVSGGVEVRVQPVAHGDFNGSGVSDVLLMNDNGTVRDWLGQAPNGNFAGNTANVNFVAAAGSHIAGTGDFNGDGRVDVLWQTSDGVVIDMLGQGDGFVDNSMKVNIRTGTEWHIVGTGDFNGDGRDDVLLQHDNGTVRDWLGQADGTFAGNIGKLNILTGPEWHVIGTGDFNGDGLADILWKHDNGTVRDWLGQADGSFTGNIDKVNILSTPDWHAIGTGDFNGDGTTDILWRNDNGTIREWLGQTNGTFIGNTANVNFVPPAGQHVVGIGDYNGDAIDDLLWSNNGTITQSLGTSTGAFADNTANVNIHTGTEWHVQDPFVHDLFT